MRLIDADAEITRIEQEIKQIDDRIESLLELAEKEPSNTIHKFSKELERCYRNITDCKAEIATLRGYKTAYDVDKVLSKLQKIARGIDDYLETGVTLSEAFFYDGKVSGIDTTIAIVKSGGIK